MQYGYNSKLARDSKLRNIIKQKECVADIEDMTLTATNELWFEHCAAKHKSHEQNDIHCNMIQTLQYARELRIQMSVTGVKLI